MKRWFGSDTRVERMTSLYRIIELCVTIKNEFSSEGRPKSGKLRTLVY